jgi:serine-type D-Ala-D-Ala endopeptidase (penicillin-binding protein 7)
MFSFKKSFIVLACLLSFFEMVTIDAYANEISQKTHELTQKSKINSSIKKIKIEHPIAHKRHLAKKHVATKKNTRVNINARKKIAQRHHQLSMMNKASSPQKNFGHQPPSLDSSVAYLLDQETNTVLYSKNSHSIVPIASLTKLMTGLLISEANLPMDELIRINDDDVDTIRHSSSRLRVGSILTRRELLHLALMSSENRAAHALARTFPGGIHHFVDLMNERAEILGMRDTIYVEPTGLSSKNKSSASDLAILAAFASGNNTMRQFTTSKESEVDTGAQFLHYQNSNRLIKNPNWSITLQKTGFINEAGRCMVVQAHVANRKVIMVLLDATGSANRIADAEKLRHWMRTIETRDI